MSQMQPDVRSGRADLVPDYLPVRHIIASAQQADAFTSRIADREDVRIDTRISVADRPRPITLINLSAHGFMGECPAGVPLRSRVSLDLPGLGPWRGSVRWSVGRRVGGRFDTPLDDGQLAAALAPA